MPNNKYLRSTKKERLLVNEARKKGAIAARSAGSKSPFDVWIWDEKNNLVTLIQVKTELGAKTYKDYKHTENKNCSVITFTRSYEKK